MCWQALKSIKYMKPCLLALENVLRLDSKSDGSTENDLQHIMRAMTAELGDLYAVEVLNGIDPARAGYPVRRGRIVILGARTDQVQISQLNLAAATLMEDRMPVDVNFRQLLGLSTDALIPWEKLWGILGQMIKGR